jgi:hypothetical protein
MDGYNKEEHNGWITGGWTPYGHNGEGGGQRGRRAIAERKGAK